MTIQCTKAASTLQLRSVQCDEAVTEGLKITKSNKSATVKGT